MAEGVHGMAARLRRWAIITLNIVLLACAWPAGQRPAAPWHDPLTPQERAAITARGPIRYSPDPQFPPFESLNAAHQAEGITPDILGLVARDLHVTITTVPAPGWSQCLQALKERRADILGTISKNQERESFLAFTRPYFDMPYVLFVRAGGPNHRDFSALAGRRVGVVKDYYAHSWLLSHRPEVIVVPEQNTQAGMEDLATGHLDAMLETLPVGLWVLRAKGITNVEVSSPVLFSEPQYLAVAKGDTVLLGILQKGLDGLSQKELGSVFARWTGLDFTKSLWRLSGTLKTVITALVLLALLILAWNFLLRRAVTRKTEELRQKEERLHLLLERNLAGVYRNTLDGRFCECNEAFANLLGYPSREAVMAINAADLYVDPSQRQAVVEKILKERQITGEVLRLKRKDGKELWAMVNETLIEAPGQEPIFEGILVDITERKRSEQALAESEAALQGVLSAAADGILAVDRQRRVIHANRRFAEVWRIPKDLLESGNDKVLLDFVLDQLVDPAAFLAKVEALYDSNQDDMDTLIFTDGRVVERYSSPMKSGDSVTGRVWSFRDITKRKRAEEKLRQADLDREKARSAEAGAHLIQGLAHEVRNPLFAINVNAAVIEKKTSEVPDVAEHIAFVKEHVDRLNALMRDLMELGRQPLAGEMIECRLRDVALAAALAAEAQAPDAAGRVFVEAPERPLTVSALPDRLQRVLVHLILNALQNSPANGRVRVRAAQSGGQAFVEVVDEGPGIPGEIHARVFEPFVTTHTGRRGLGLALAKHYVTAMGGTLEAANNDPPPGATLTVRLPVA